ncbi:polyamine ABC transporter permease [Trinickia symbiotica]|uniref:Polyamine ABC transporter permease n=1 Tax=Trinickia symbiotica TaxID=863227 RepID=A0A2T3XRH3_9BURK|nr:ABC transporter permease [Trinickia symbiotica]PTB19052.1 polyamine ABC transporter permease [Trinickia symbiotica]
MRHSYYSSTALRFAWRSYVVLCVLIFAFLLLPLLVIIPLSFNALPYFSFTPGMLRLSPSAYSLQWYEEVIGSRYWQLALWNSLFIGLFSTAIATVLGTLAALGMERARFPGKELVSAGLLLPIFAPTIVLATGLYFLYAKLGLLETRTGIIFAHAAIASPYVLISVRAALSMVDSRLTKAAQNLGANPVSAFLTVTLPLALPGVIGGAVLAFVTSFDELVIVLFIGGGDTTTIPRQMWTGVREDLSPRVLAVSTMLTVSAVVALTFIQVIRRSAERRNRTVTP